MATYEKEFLLKVLENLWKVRKFEQRAMEGGLKGEIKGNIHVCLGEEGAVVGANMALESTDYITASHRGHGHCVMKSDDVEHTLAELYGKESGFCHGRGGSMHVTKVESGLLGAVDDGRLAPLETATRAQVAAILTRFSQRFMS